MLQRVHRHDVSYLSKGVTKTLTVKYDMAGTVNDVLNLRYDIFNTVNDTLELQYDIPLTRIGDTLELQYNIRPALFLKLNLGDFIGMSQNDLGDFTG